jgi:tRNA nucleotidyltransferase (CCA-adding enzyme)
MARDWEAWLATASGPPSATEEQERDHTAERIQNAIRAASDIPASVRVYAKGSYANGTNVRRDADVDVAVEWNETIKVMKWGETTGMPATAGLHTGG